MSKLTQVQQTFYKTTPPKKYLGRVLVSIKNISADVKLGIYEQKEFV